MRKWKKGYRVVSWEDGRCQILLKGGGCGLSPIFILFVFDVNQGNKEVEWIQDFSHGPRDGKTLLTSSAIR